MAIDERDLKADPAIVRTWVEGWALTRQVAPPVFENGGYRVEVGLPDQLRRFVFPRYSDVVRQHAEEIAEPFVFLKVCAPPELVQSNLPPQWRIEAPGFMMSLSGTMTGGMAALPDEYTFVHEEFDGMSLVNVLHREGEVAATGRIGFPGELAVYDRISTHENHRRKGLGRSVMKRLEMLSREKGIQRAALVATPDGRALYEPLGWQLHCLYTTAVIPKPGA